MRAIDNMPTVACFWTWIIGKWIIMDNRLGGVDNICVLRRRTARNAVTRPTTGHSEGGRSAWHRQETWHDFKTSVYNIVGCGIMEPYIH